MKRLTVILLLSIAGNQLCGQVYTVTGMDSEAMFLIKNLGSTVRGSFTGWQGKIIFDPSDLSTASFNVSLDAGSINTGNVSRDKHLKKSEYFDVISYPKLQFNSMKVTGNNAAFTMTGQLTIKGVTKQISFPFTARQEGGGYRFLGQFSINRRNFNVGGSSWFLSDNLVVTLNLLVVK